MNRDTLMEDLVRAFKEIFKGYTLLNRNKELQQIEVYAQYIPQPSGATFGNAGLKNYTESDYDSHFPCIVVKLEDMTDAEERSMRHSSVKVRVLAGICDWTEKCEGWKHLLDIQERIRTFLLEHRVLGRKFVLRMPVVSRLIDVETWPVYFGEMELLYECGRPLQNSEYVYRPKAAV